MVHNTSVTPGASAHRAWIAFFAIAGTFFASGLASPVRAEPAFQTSGPGAYQFYDPSPSGEIRVTTPCISWEVTPPVGMRVTAVMMTLDDAVVQATYDDKKHIVSYTPDMPLRSGKHRVTCTLTLDDKFKIPKQPLAWEFSVSSGALATIPAPTAEQESLFSSINALRQNLKKPLLVLDKRLCAAATAHSMYQIRNKLVTHTQKTDAPGFLGTTANERTGKMGFDKPCFETVGQGFGSPQEALQRTFDAPYHRAAFLQPGSYEVGIGMAKDNLTLNFALSSASGLVPYPSAGQNHVPTEWDGVETNGPLRLHGVSEVHEAVGYPITLFLFGPDNPRLSHVKATISTGDGTSIPFYLNSPDNDANLQGETVSGVMLTPKKPLHPNTTYKVSIFAVESDGEEVTRSWSFTTGSGT